MDVGTVQDMSIDGDHILMKFTTGTHTIGTESRVSIRTDTLLGKKVLEIEPRGAKRMRPNDVLPVGQSTTPYQVYDAFFDVTKAAAGWNIDTVKESLNVLSRTINQTYPHLSAALDGVAKFSDIIGKRDDDLKHLLTEARKVAGVLGDRSKQINALLRNTQTLLAAFNERGKAIAALLANVSAFSTQVQGLINDNPNLHHLLEQLRGVTDVLTEHKNDLASVLNTLRSYTAALSEAVGSGPILQGDDRQPAAVPDPAAVGRRGVQETRHRSGELLAQCGIARLPVARPERHTIRQRRAAAGAAGARRHPRPPRPGRGAGIAVLVCAAGGDVAAAGQPDAVCRHRSRAGPVRAQTARIRLCPTCFHRRPTPMVYRRHPGYPMPGCPVAPAPNVPGTPVPLPPNAPPGARRESLLPPGLPPPPT